MYQLVCITQPKTAAYLLLLLLTTMLPQTMNVAILVATPCELTVHSIVYETQARAVIVDMEEGVINEMLKVVPACLRVTALKLFMLFKWHHYRFEISHGERALHCICPLHSCGTYQNAPSFMLLHSHDKTHKTSYTPL